MSQQHAKWPGPEHRDTLINKYGINPVWLNEPEELMWFDSLSGMTCLIVRRYSLCGYVEIDPKSPLLKLAQWPWKGPMSSIRVHGGITFSGEFKAYPDRYWVGFDTAHGGDMAPGMLTHYLDYPELMDAALLKLVAKETYRDFNYVQHECMRLAEQLAQLECELIAKKLKL